MKTTTPATQTHTKQLNQLQTQLNQLQTQLNQLQQELNALNDLNPYIYNKNSFKSNSNFFIDFQIPKDTQVFFIAFFIYLKNENIIYFDETRFYNSEFVIEYLGDFPTQWGAAFNRLISEKINYKYYGDRWVYMRKYFKTRTGEPFNNAQMSRKHNTVKTLEILEELKNEYIFFKNEYANE